MACGLISISALVLALSHGYCLMPVKCGPFTVALDRWELWSILSRRLGGITWVYELYAMS